ncbi:MAG: tetratricopeptide repeat protein, partial [Candidatus Eiseniibacteriota bacterium]
MRRSAPVTLAAAVVAAALISAIALAAAVALAARPAGKPTPPKPTDKVSPDEQRLNRATEALAQGRVDDARALMDEMGAGARANPDDYAYLKGMLLEDGNAYVAALEGYLKDMPKGKHRREVTLGLGSARYARGEYAETENLLSVFSPGVEKDFIGRRALVQRGLAQLARGDAAGALQFLRS